MELSGLTVNPKYYNEVPDWAYKGVLGKLVYLEAG